MTHANHVSYQDVKIMIAETQMCVFYVRKGLKQKWCSLLNRNCPKRIIYCCEDHIKIEEDIEYCENWIFGSNTSGIPGKNIAPASPLNEVSVDIEPTTSSVNDIAPKTCSIEKCVQTLHCADAAVQAKPSTKNKSTNFRSRKITRKIVPSLMSHMSEPSPSTSASLFGTSNFDSSSSSTVANTNEKLGREHLLKTIKK